jgi:very-short-patch-repair endonuclease
MYRGSTPQAQKLQAALEDLGIPVQPEKWDGHKSIDLAIPRAQLNIEVDGKQHLENAGQILRDLERSHHSDDKGFATVHVPNAFIDSEKDFPRVVNALAKVARIRLHKRGHRLHFHAY